MFHDVGIFMAQSVSVAVSLHLCLAQAEIEAEQLLKQILEGLGSWDAYAKILYTATGKILKVEAVHGDLFAKKWLVRKNSEEFLGP